MNGLSRGVQWLCGTTHGTDVLRHDPLLLPGASMTALRGL